ncbi:TPA: hypothetical protein ACVOYQ_001304 [Vibrio alginolyticus]
MTPQEKDNRVLALELACSVIECAYDALCLQREGVKDDLCWALKGLYESLVDIDCPCAQKIAGLANIVSENISSGVKFKPNDLLNILTFMLNVAQKSLEKPEILPMLLHQR